MKAQVEAYVLKSYEKGSPLVSVLQLYYVMLRKKSGINHAASS